MQLAQFPGHLSNVRRVDRGFGLVAIVLGQDPASRSWSGPGDGAPSITGTRVSATRVRALCRPESADEVTHPARNGFPIGAHATGRFPVARGPAVV